MPWSEDRGRSGSAPNGTAPAARLDRASVCPRCCGTGLVCGPMTPIGPGTGCQDYANRFCPDCGGTGRRPAPPSAALSAPDPDHVEDG